MLFGYHTHSGASKANVLVDEYGNARLSDFGHSTLTHDGHMATRKRGLAFSNEDMSLRDLELYRATATCKGDSNSSSTVAEEVRLRVHVIHSLTLNMATT